MNKKEIKLFMEIDKMVDDLQILFRNISREHIQKTILNNGLNVKKSYHALKASYSILLSDDIVI